MTESHKTDYWVKGLEHDFVQGWFASLTAITFDKKTDCLAFAGARGRILWVDLHTFDFVEPKRTDAGVSCLCFTENCHMIAGLENGSLVRISPQGTHLLTKKISRKSITSLAYSRQFGLIAAAADQTLRRIDPTTLSEIATSEKQRWMTRDLEILDAEKQLLAAGSDNKLHLIDGELLAPLLEIHEANARQTHTTAGHGHLVTAGENGAVTLLDSGSYIQNSVLPIDDETLAGVQIPSEHPSLFLANQCGTVQEWDLDCLEPKSALQVEEATKALAVAPSGDVVAVCTSKSLRVYLRASQLDQFDEYHQELSYRQSFLGRLVQIVRRLFRRPIPALPPAPKLPRSLAFAALNTDPEIRQFDRTTSEELVRAYRGLASAARRIDWKDLSNALDKHQRRQQEAQLLELRRLREVRLGKAMAEAKQRREARQQLLQERQRAILKAKAEAQAERIMRLIFNVASTAVGSGAAGSWVSSYTRKDGTRVSGYRRR
jgi:hypothetical protein